MSRSRMHVANLTMLRLRLSWLLKEAKACFPACRDVFSFFFSFECQFASSFIIIIIAFALPLLLLLPFLPFRNPVAVPSSFPSH